MGVVFSAYDRVLDEEVAIKIVRAEYAGDRAWAQRLAREVKLTRQINHPNVCRVFEFGQAEAHPFLIMELARRGTLRDEIASGGISKRPLEGRLSDVRSLASGLAAIHAAGIIHRDVTPQNALRMDDGPLVLSDFGLATDDVDGGTSMHGGTMAYMAPEVVRAGHASVASDIWSLSVVMHEAMFGMRPRWAANGREMLRPVLGRSLSDAERMVFEVCRACASASPDQRPHSASRVSEALTRGVRLSARFGGLRGLYAAGLVASMGLSAALVGNFVRGWHGSTGGGLEAEVLRVSGDAQDWTTKSKVLAVVPEKIHCMTVLPDRRTVRFVWGLPRRAEDIDSHTGHRIPSPLVVAAYAEGCPDMASDGSKVVFAGHDRDLRPFAFVSEHPDGSAAVPVVATAEPSLATDPAWLPDNDSFLYSVDISHSAVFSLANRASVVIPADTHLANSAGYQVAGDAIMVTTSFPDRTTELRRLRLPHLDQDLRLRIEGFLLDPATQDGRHYFLTRVGGGNAAALVVVDAVSQRAVRSIVVQGRRPGHVVATDAGLAFAAASVRGVLIVERSAGDVHEFDLPPNIWAASACGDVVVAERGGAGSDELVRLDWSGRVLERMTLGSSPRLPKCSTDGKVLYFAEGKGNPTVVRCEGARCAPIYRGFAASIHLSPDNQRLVILAVGDDGLTVRWLRADGQGPAHDVLKTQVGCAPGWSSVENIWIATRHGRDIVWREFTADTGKPTGVSASGSWDCMDGWADPHSPIRDPVRVAWRVDTEIRLMQGGEPSHDNEHF